MCAKCKFQLGEHLIDHNSQNAANLISDASDSVQNLLSKQFFVEVTLKDLIKIQQMISDTCSDNENNEKLINAPSAQHSDEIFLINEALRELLLNVANKLLGRQHLNFEQLTPSEQELWNKFENSDNYKFLTGEKYTVPAFWHHWVTFSATPKVNIDTSKIAQTLTPIPPEQIPAAIQWTLSAAHNLRQWKDKIDYWALTLGSRN
jgi:hypothetical protein